MTILFTTTAATVIDITSSISSPPHLQLISSAPPATPFTPPEPEVAQLPQQLADETHCRLLPLITAALASLPPGCAYHRPRCTEPPLPLDGELDFHANTALLLPYVEHNSEETDAEEMTECPADAVDDISDVYATLIHNSRDDWAQLTLRHPAPPQKKFLIPPRASFFLGPLPSPSTSSPSSSSSAPSFTRVLGRRDLVLLDPPWPNASAKRKASYRTETRFSIIPLLRGLPIGEVLKPAGLVAVWITNKPAVRKQLRGLFDAWRVEPVAEWVWLKVTSAGEPIVALDRAGGRRPYEVLVFARRAGEGEVVVPGKVLIGVPDLHSRKPGIRGRSVCCSVIVWTDNEVGQSLFNRSFQRNMKLRKSLAGI